MAKNKKNESEDEIIANGLLMIRDGFLKDDWELVASGYEHITGDNLEKPKKSKLELIREKVKKSSAKTIEIFEEVPDDISETNSAEVGSDPTGKYKISPVDLVKSGERGGDLVHKVSATVQKGGKRFGTGNIICISDIPDPEEKKENEELAKKTRKQKRQPTENILKKFNNPEGEFRFDPTNRGKPTR